MESAATLHPVFCIFRRRPSRVSLSLISLLENTPEDLAHQRIGFYSYGSGCVAEFFSGIVQKDYQDRLKKNDHQKMLENRESLSEEEYTAFYNFRYPVDGGALIITHHNKRQYRLAAIEQHKRIYEKLD